MVTHQSVAFKLYSYKCINGYEINLVECDYYFFLKGNRMK